MKKIKTEHKGRRCKRPGCKNILSIYNHEIFCHIHQNKCDFESKLKTALA